VFAGSTLNTAGLSPSLVQEIQRLILTTASHQAEPGDRNAPLLLDADLAILGAAADEYQKYAQAIRQEYAWVDEASYRQGRGRVLQQFCQRERIYLTQPLYEQRETLARYNLQQELERLKHEELPQVISARCADG
jgi:predicted metal-dependent HD superfamily phosphohydrolase